MVSSIVVTLNWLLDIICNVLGTAIEVGDTSSMKLWMGNTLTSRAHDNHIMAVLLLSYHLHITSGAYLGTQWLKFWCTQLCDNISA